MAIHKQTRTKKINGFIKDTTNKMKDLGTYKIEFDTTIRSEERRVGKEC